MTERGPAMPEPDLSDEQACRLFYQMLAEAMPAQAAELEEDCQAALALIRKRQQNEVAE